MKECCKNRLCVIMSSSIGIVIGMSLAFILVKIFSGI